MIYVIYHYNYLNPMIVIG